MEQLFDQVSLIKTLKGGIKKGYWDLEDLDRPPPGWKEVVNDCKGNPLFPKVIKVSNTEILLGLKNPQNNRRK